VPAHLCTDPIDRAAICPTLEQLVDDDPPFALAELRVPAPGRPFGRPPMSTPALRLQAQGEALQPAIAVDLELDATPLLGLAFQRVLSAPRPVDHDRSGARDHQDGYQNHEARRSLRGESLTHSQIGRSHERLEVRQVRLRRPW